MSDALYLALVIAVMTAATFLTRVTPFVLLHHKADHPLLLFLGRYTPPAIMTLLVLYSLQGVDWQAPPHGTPELAAVALTLLLHGWRRNALLSIFGGTGFYMAVLQGGLF